MSTSSTRTIGIYITLFLLSALLTYTFRPHSFPSTPFRSSTPPVPTPAPGSPRYAYATFLAGHTAGSPSDSDSDDGYFLGARVLAYQLLHSPTTSTNLSLPLLVLVTDDVSPSKRARLAADGATVIPVAKLPGASWIRPGATRWRDVLTKLRLWELDAYDKLCFLDSDTLLTSRLDGVFSDAATVMRPTAHDAAEPVEGPQLPRGYMLASHVDYFGYAHTYPPPAAGAEGASSYFNVGFFVMRPSRELFAYYSSLLAPEMEGLFDPMFPEQNLLNHAHREGGPMEWARLWPGWNVNWPTERDWRDGVGSFHAKYWDADPSHDQRLKQIWREQRAEMEGFWAGREAAVGEDGVPGPPKRAGRLGWE